MPIQQLGMPLFAFQVITQTIPSHLLPLHPLPRDWQLPSQASEAPLVQSHQRAIDLLLICLLQLRYRSDYFRSCASGIRLGYLFRGVECYVAVFIVVHLGAQRAFQAVAVGVVEKSRAPATRDEILRTCLRRSKEDSNVSCF